MILAPFVFDLAGFTGAVVTAFRRPYRSLRYNLALSVFLTAVLGLLVFVRLMQLFDHLLFPGYHRQPIEAPIYILATPRSGTTFLHRLLCLDEQFTTFQLWHTLVPSILVMRVTRALARIDAHLGGPFRRVVHGINHLSFKGWEGMHAMGLDRTEEDEFLWVNTNLTPSIALWFPFLHRLDKARFVDRLPERMRSRLARYYRDALKRQLYAVGHGKRLLVKSALAGGRIRTMLEAVPDMRIVYLVRHPYDALPSLLSMFTRPWRWHSPHLRLDGPEGQAFAQLGIDYYKAMYRLRQELPPEQYIEFRYDDLIADPQSAIECMYAHFGIPLSPDFRTRLEAEVRRAQQYNSNHAYDLAEYGLTREFIADELTEVLAHYGFPR